MNRLSVATCATTVLLASTVAETVQSKGRPVVGVAEMQLIAANVDCRPNCRRFAEGFRTMLETAIVKSRKMEVFERARLDPVLAEQMLGQTGISRAGGRVGGLAGVDYLVYGTITKFGKRVERTSTEGLSAFGGNIGRIGSMFSTEKDTVDMGVDLKVTEVRSGRIVVADQVEGSVTSGQEFSIGGISSSQGSADPFADVQRLVAAKIAEAVVTARIPIKILKVQANGTLVLNYGNVFLKEGDVLSAFNIGERIVDPDTNEVLGAEETLRGSVVVIEARQKFSRARFDDQPFEISRGDVLRRPSREAARRRTDERTESGPSWDGDDPAQD